MIQLNVNIPFVNGDKSLQKLVENIQFLTSEESSVDSIQSRMESLEDQLAGIVARVSKCEDQAGTVEGVLERLNRLAESIELLEGDNRSIREREHHDVTNMRDMMDSLNEESRNIIDRIDSIDQMNTSNTAQQDAAHRQNLSLIEESLMKHEEHSAELEDLRKQLEKANKLNTKLSAKLTEISDKYDELAKESTDRENKTDVLQSKQIDLIESLQNRIKLLEAQLSETSSPCPFSPISASGIGEETGGRTDKDPYTELEKENEKLLEKIDKLQVENIHLKEDLADPLTDEEIISNSSGEEPPMESMILPKPILSNNKTDSVQKLKQQSQKEKIKTFETLLDSLKDDHRELITRIAHIQSNSMRSKLQTPRTPYVWLLDQISMHIEREDLVYSEAFISDKSDHKIGAMLDFSMAKSSHSPSLAFYLTMLPGDNDKKLKWPFKANFKITIINNSNNSESYVKKFTDSGNRAFQMPLMGKDINLFGLTKFISVPLLMNPQNNALYVRKNRMEIHIELQVTN